MASTRRTCIFLLMVLVCEHVCSTRKVFLYFSTYVGCVCTFGGRIDASVAHHKILPRSISLYTLLNTPSYIVRNTVELIQILALLARKKNRKQIK